MKIRLHPDHEARLAALAASSGRSVEEVMREALVLWEQRPAPRSDKAKHPRPRLPRVSWSCVREPPAQRRDHQGSHRTRACVTFVLDNSVAMRWCFDDAVHPYADSVLRRLAGGETAVVPLLWLYEASAVLARAQSRGTLVAAKAGEFITELQALDITVVEESAARGCSPTCTHWRSPTG